MEHIHAPSFRPVLGASPRNPFSETQLIVRSGDQTHVRVVKNNEQDGTVEIEFHELEEIPFHYPYVSQD